jgi:hypothetical protein
MSDRVIGDECYLKPDPVTGRLRPVQRNGELPSAKEIEIGSVSADKVILVSPNGHSWEETISDLGIVSWKDLGS